MLLVVFCWFVAVGCFLLLVVPQQRMLRGSNLLEEVRRFGMWNFRTTRIGFELPNSRTPGVLEAPGDQNVALWRLLEMFGILALWRLPERLGDSRSVLEAPGDV